MFRNIRLTVITSALFLLMFMLLPSEFVLAQSSQNPQSGAAGLSGTVPVDPPTQGATITLPANGQVFTASQTDVTGICPQGLLVKLFKNDVFAGSATCDTGSFTITAELFSGQNVLVARVYDALDQPGPDSNKPVVTFDDGSGTGEAIDRLLLTSNFAKRGANPGATLSWPITLTGGTGPYAISVDWGDGEHTLLSQDLAGDFTPTHVYELAGTYRIAVQATDANNLTAFLQLVGVANGAVQDNPLARTDTSGSNGDAATIQPSSTTNFKLIIWPLYVMIALIITTFWIGRRYEVKKLKKKLASQQTLF